MGVKIFSADSLAELTRQAGFSTRLRQHLNIHQSYLEPCQRLFNAIEPDSYIRPHRHTAVPRDELLIAIRGLMALVTFDDDGKIKNVLRFGSEKYGAEIAAGVEVDSDTWHTVLALAPGSVLLEVKAGPFDPDQPKEFAHWAPDETSEHAKVFFEGLRTKVQYL